MKIICSQCGLEELELDQLCPRCLPEKHTLEPGPLTAEEWNLEADAFFAPMRRAEEALRKGGGLITGVTPDGYKKSHRFGGAVVFALGALCGAFTTLLLTCGVRYVF